MRYLFGKSLQANSKLPNETPQEGQSYSPDGATTSENDQHLSDDDIEQVSKYIKDLINNE
ncbi:hypothetical protein [Peribacillus alkalitolerans]|uniref:hypothetical protein n=1 Tax=Peribacillus alkalitolerans TaxID=1550385 RepID=UPI0013D17D7F|nr:hypothetical protein [Peribacillus alkalitolerans]